MHRKMSLFERYIMSLFRGLSLLTGIGFTFHRLGAPNSCLDYWYILMMSIVGKTITAITLAIIYDKVSVMRSSASKYEEIISELAVYMRRKCLEKGFRSKIYECFRRKYETTYFREDLIMNTIPNRLKNDIELFKAR